MKLFMIHPQALCSKPSFAALILAVFASLASATRPAGAATVIGGISNAEIRNVVQRVAKHQIHLLSDGDYPTVKTFAEAEASGPPKGISWSYPQGLMLYGLIR